MVVSWRKRTLAVVAALTLVGCAADSGDETAAPALIGGGNTLAIAFPTMYSASDGIHSFKIPAIVQNVMADSWDIDPRDAADLTEDGTGGVMITTRRPGEFKVIATAGKLRGEAPLYVTEATPDQWMIGEARYKNNVMITGPDPNMMMMMGPPMLNIPENAACGNCHGQGGTMLNVEHTPQQIGGFSDDELITIFTTGTKPVGSPFRSMIPPFFYRMFHTWATADENEARALVVYLRSLEPKSQEGINFRPPGSGPPPAAPSTPVP